MCSVITVAFLFFSLYQGVKKKLRDDVMTTIDSGLIICGSLWLFESARLECTTGL